MNSIPLETAMFHPRRWTWTAGAFVAIAVVGVVDYHSGPEITFSVFYLVPVAAAAWLAGTAVAITASAFAAVVWLTAEFASSRLDSDPFVYVWNFCARLLFLLLVALLLARLREMLGRERQLSRTDALTGLLNARAFREIAEAEIARAQRYALPLSLAFVDVDGFKRVNDTRGHSTGDRLLRHIAELIKVNLRGSDFVARYGGDEFVVLLPVTDEDAARAATEKLREKVREVMLMDNLPVTLSIGVATWQPGGPTATVDSMLESADRLMYEAKSSGKGAAGPAATGP